MDRIKESEGGGQDIILVDRIKENKGGRRGLDMGGQD